MPWILIALCTLELAGARYAPGRQLRRLLLWLPGFHIAGGIAVFLVASWLFPDGGGDPDLTPIVWVELTSVYELLLVAIAIIALVTVLVLNLRASVFPPQVQRVRPLGRWAAEREPPGGSAP